MLSTIGWAVTHADVAQHAAAMQPRPARARAQLSDERGLRRGASLADVLQQQRLPRCNPDGAPTTHDSRLGLSGGGGCKRLRCLHGMLGLHVTSALVVAAARHSCLLVGCFHLAGLSGARNKENGALRCAAQVENAINRATKEKRVAELTEALEQSTVVFGLRYRKISVRPFVGP